MVAIQIQSDLHLETPKSYDIFEIPVKAPYLALLGDIGLVSHGDEYFAFLRQQLVSFKITFLVLGNHEPWHSTWDECVRSVRKYEKQVQDERLQNPSLGKFVLLDRTRYDLGDECEGGDERITVLGCTLFSRVPQESIQAVSFGINDFYRTEDWTVEKHNAMFEVHLQWLNEQVAALEGSGRKIVVFTHYSPTFDERAVYLSQSPIHSNFATDLRAEACWRSADVKLWAFGHTHFNCDFVDGTGKRVLTNQRGYYFRQSERYEAEKCAELSI